MIERRYMLNSAGCVTPYYRQGSVHISILLLPHASNGFHVPVVAGSHLDFGLLAYIKLISVFPAFTTRQTLRCAAVDGFRSIAQQSCVCLCLNAYCILLTKKYAELVCLLKEYVQRYTALLIQRDSVRFFHQGNLALAGSFLWQSCKRIFPWHVWESCPTT